MARINISEWQTDEQGRRFRYVGNSREYAATVRTTHGEFFADDAPGILDAIKKREDEQRAKEAAEHEAKLKAQDTNYICPFKGEYCEGEKCALFSGNACIFRPGHDNSGDTGGKSCPIPKMYHTCKKDCVLFNGGCNMSKLAAMINQ